MKQVPHSLCCYSKVLVDDIPNNAIRLPYADKIIVYENEGLSMIPLSLREDSGIGRADAIII